MTNAEIAALYERLSLERQLKGIRPSTYERGMGLAKAVLTAGTTLASIHALSQTPLAADIKNTLKKSVAHS